ncbi:dihydroorotase [Planosporangium mesophilum]|nr:dihydroorotase [Planosporangium mesophilum]
MPYLPPRGRPMTRLVAREPEASSTSLRIRRPDDFHLHLRQHDMLRAVLPATGRHFARALVMPNTDPPVADADALARYRSEIVSANEWPFEPLMTIKLTAGTGDKTVRLAGEAGAVAAKLYPRGVTTNSADGVDEVDDLYPAFAAMVDVGMVLCVHGESPDAFCLDREEAFLSAVLPRITSEFPTLRVVVEHASTAAAVRWVRDHRDRTGTSTVAATITVHHLLLTLDDVIGDLLSPHHFCKPVAKRPEDRAALVEAATSGDPAFFLGTDSAPHAREAKECASGCAGVFTAPVALPVLAQVFESAGALDRLERFTSVAGAHFYGLPLNEGVVTLRRERWRVPAEYHGVVPFLADRYLDWRVSEDGE